MTISSGQIESALLAGEVALDPTSALPATPPKYNPMNDPLGTEMLCRAVSGIVGAWKPTLIMVWEDPEDMVLAHVVGRELGVPWVRVLDADGLIEHMGRLAPTDRVLLLADAFRDQRRVRAMVSLIAKLGASTVGAAAFVETDLQRSLRDDLPRVASLVAYPSRVVDGDAG